MKLHIVGIALGVILGLPIVALGSSFTYSLIQGKTPAEAVTIIANQLDGLFGRVDTLEDKQQVLEDRVTSLEEKNPDIDPALDERKLPPQEVEVLKHYSLDTEAQDICRQTNEQPSQSGRSLIGDIKMLCVKAVNEKFANQDQFNSVVESIKEKWRLYEQSE